MATLRYVTYCIEDGTDWEIGEGTVTDAATDTLSRDTVIASSNAGSAVNWGAGTKRVFCVVPARDVSRQSIASYGSNQTLTVTECRGYVIYVTGAATITLPAIADGMSVTIITIGAVAVSVDPNASDLIYLDGTALDDGDKITNLSAAGDIAVLTYYSADGWYASTNGWTDGGA